MILRQVKPHLLNDFPTMLFSSWLKETSYLVWNWRAKAFLKLTDQMGSSLEILAEWISPLVIENKIGLDKTVANSPEI